MAIIDIVILIILALFIFIGVTKGFTASLLSLCGWFLSLVISIFLARPFANLLETILPFDVWIGEPIENWLSQNSFLNTAIPQTEEEILLALTNAGIPENIAELLTPTVKGILPDLQGKTVTLAQVIAPAIMHCIVLVISFILLNILVRLLVILLQRLLKGVIDKIPLVNAVDRTLGGVFGFGKAIFLIFAGVMILTPLKTYDFMDWYEKDVDKSLIGKFVEENNFLANWLFGGIKDYVGEDIVNEETPKDNTESYLTKDKTEIYKIISNNTEKLGFNYLDIKNYATMRI